MKAARSYLRAMRFAAPIGGTPRVEPCWLTSVTTLSDGPAQKKKPDRLSDPSDFDLLTTVYQVLQDFFTVLLTLYFLCQLALGRVCDTFELLTSDFPNREYPGSAPTISQSCGVGPPLNLEPPSPSAPTSPAQEPDCPPRRCWLHTERVFRSPRTAGEHRFRNCESLA